MKRNRWFHGTNEGGMRDIFKNGFKIGTYFTEDMDYACCFGEYVFVVDYEIKLKKHQITEQLSTDVVNKIYNTKLIMKRTKQYNVTHGSE